MSEIAKTGLFVGVAVLALVAAIFSRPTPPPSSSDGLVSMKSLNPIDDPLAAQELEIIRWDPALGDKIDFNVARIDGVWKIPSHGDYPADADRQMGDAATAATNLKPLGVQSTNNADHELYGVIDPESAKPGTSGVGTRVVMKNGKGETLVSTIIGKEVKGESGQRFIRQVGKDPVYIVKIDPSKFSTKFEDWIEKDLLKINTLDIAKVNINDYSVKLAQTQGGLGLLDNRRGEMVLSYDDAKSVWSVEKLLKWNEETREMVPDEIPPGEEINNVKLNEMKSALADLKIIDVQRKPEGMSSDLKAEQDFIKNQQAIQNLMARGFYPVRGEGDNIDILSSEGDFIVKQKDGVEYVLRFGNIKLGSGPAEEEEGAAGEKKPDTPEKGENRFLFVAARFNPDMIEKPVKPAILEEPAAEEPATDAPAETSDGEKTEAAPAEGEAAPKEEDAAPAEAEKTEEKSPAKKEQAAEPEADESASLTIDQQDGGAVDQPTPAAKKAAAEKQAAEPADEEKADSSAADKNESPPAVEEETTEPAAEPAAEESAKEAPAKEQPATKEAPQAAPDDAAAKREAAELQYNRAMDEYNDKVEKAQQRVTELNGRFGDWYYVISDDVFKKIHITRKDLFVPKESEKKAGEAGPGEETPKSSIPLDAPESIKED